MKILHVAHFFYPCLSAGGVVNASYQIASNQSKDNDVKVISSDSCKERLKFPNGRYDVDVDGIKVDYFKNLSNGFKLKTMLDTPLAAPFKIRKDIKDYDIVHIHEHRQTLAIIASYFARKNNIPYIVQAHGSVLPFFQKEGLKNLFDKVFGFKILHNASCVFALTEVEKEQYLKMGVDEERIEIVPLGINLEEYENLPSFGKFRSKFNIAENDKLILFVGRIHEIKGLGLLIDAFNDLINQNYEKNSLEDTGGHSIKLAIVGPDDGYLTELEDKIKEYSLEENVIITGPLYKEEKQEALVDCDLFVMPSKYESFTTSGLEAMACSKPLVLTKNNHIHDWVDGNVGLACEDNKDSLREAIEKVLFDEELSQIFAENGRKLINEKYNWDIINDQILEIYRKFL
ncbi:MAG: glycosyltransferase [Methanobrevibacter ruminantium]|uniref:glycosyltransferase n=1 Tax=Methanobrevibacter ruminantium TaxID=83816 RepID=UPI0026F10577|nr:glycosyltransferase [Methanobrevibacter ruminantium]MCI5737517.1 glycosyltransferase [Methanobrevibacter ruminantium]MDO5842241.1 glycosyltransferase [Methanobrevibacter ruminantium]